MARPRPARIASAAAGAVLSSALVLLAAPGAQAAPLAAPTASAAVVEVGGTVTLSGTGCFAPAGAVHPAEVYAGGYAPGQRYKGYGTVADNGSWTLPVQVKADTPLGDLDIVANCDYYADGGEYPAVRVRVVPRGWTPPATPTTNSTSTSPAPGAATVTKSAGGKVTITAQPGQNLTPEAPLKTGATVTLRFTGFAPGEKVRLVLHSDPIDLGTFQADAAGVVVVPFTVPAGAATGQHNLVATGADGVVRQYPLSITAVATGAGGSLAYTGADPTVPLVTGAALVALGGGLLLAARRRSSTGAQV